MHLVVSSSFNALTRHPARSFLTILGVIIGTAGIIATIAIGKGSQQKARDQILGHGARSMSIRVGNFLSSQQTTKAPRPFSLADLKTITQQCPSIAYLSPASSDREVNTSYGEKKIKMRISGGNEHAFLIGEESCRLGASFTDQHCQYKELVVVLNPEAAKALFPLENPIGKTITIAGYSFIVIGVLNPPKIPRRWDLGQPEGIIPFSTAQKIFCQIPYEFYQIHASVYDMKDIPKTKRMLTKILRSLRHIEQDAADDFMIFDIQTMAEVAEEGAKTVGWFAFIAASIALLVGGIGIMNIMLVAVQERIKEIGIKLAIGATQSIIRSQFLIEAVALCSAGGLVGVIGGIGATIVITHLLGLPTIIEVIPILLAFLITAFIGIFFGFYPAYKASQLDPVKALTEY